MTIDQVCDQIVVFADDGVRVSPATSPTTLLSGKIVNLIKLSEILKKA